MTCSDDQVETARNGDLGAFRCLVATHGRAVFNVCWRITRDRQLAEDAAQEAFCSVWRALPSFDGRSAFSTWLHRIAVNAALGMLRRNARHRAESPLISSDGESDASNDFLDPHEEGLALPDQHADGAQMLGAVQRQLDEMSSLERAAFVLRHVEGESLESIAQTLSLNIGQSKQAIFRAVRKLRVGLASWRPE
jgi:RNA polymerase sigma-70 factor (ECF subfamily)